MAFQVKRFSWVKRPTHWEYARAWRAQRANMVQRFRDEAAVAGSAITTTQINLSVGMANLTARTSMARAQSEINAAKAAAQNSLNRLS
jgi:hypothetical protein